MRGREGTLLTLATLDDQGRPTWHGLWIGRSKTVAVGATVPSSLLSESSHLSGTSAHLVDLLQAAARSYVEFLEGIASRFDQLEARADPPPLDELVALQRAVAAARQHVVRVTVLVADLEGPLGTSFPGISGALATVRSEVGQLEALSSGLAQGVRDLVAIRNALEANRLAEAANRLGESSNRIAALANTSNLRMLGVAYLALFLALVSVVILFPNTAATILGMPSAAWVPGLWVDVVLVVLAIVPMVLIFSRPWVRRMLSGLATYESRSAEGLADLPEIPPGAANDPSAAEGLIPPSR
ncbi:MAG: hypothetical protein ABSB97_06850 [Thermoplasmata archaeon]